MQILVITRLIPMRDRSAGWFRFYHVLRILAKNHEVHLHPLDLQRQCEKYGADDIRRYCSELEHLGVRFTNGLWDELIKLLRATAFDIALFEHYQTGKHLLDKIRFWQPQARVIIDTIDVAYHRLASKARLTNELDDIRQAQIVKLEELSVYSRSDLVIAISHFDLALLHKEDLELRVEVVPLIYITPPFRETTGRPVGTLLFVAHFEHEANVDGIVDFCRHVLPLIKRSLPNIKLRIVGHSPPEAVRELAGPNVEVLGFVPDIQAIYESSDVAIAPMRFGGGLKGKIAEAMAHGLPVVTNSVCLEGFGLTPGRDVLVGDNPEEFAHAVIEVFRDATMYQAIRENGWNYIRQHFSEEVVARMVNDIVDRSLQYPPKKLSMSKWVGWGARRLLEKHVLWRVRRGTPEGSL